MEVKIGDIFLSTADYSLYKVTEYRRESLLNYKSNMIYILEVVDILEDNFDKKKGIGFQISLKPGFWENQEFGYRWIPVPNGIPDVCITEGMGIRIAGGHFASKRHYAYNVSEKSLSLIEKGVNPETYMKSYYKATPMERVKRLFFSGWWSENKEE